MKELTESVERICKDKDEVDALMEEAYLIFKRSHDDIKTMEKTRRKSYVSPYAKFDRIKKIRR